MGVDAVFLPSSEEIYQKGDSFFIDEDSLSKKLEGSSRPHFFKGVLTVVGKLFNKGKYQYINEIYSTLASNYKNFWANKVCLD